ncbi:MAG: hypothetical protein CME25_02855 [Gemmatimonadetes bacterium]|nr:hypothetical protein [Gemmatimonadota bacterium]|tara:strand:- start:15091 stop:17523 length:2433 start_codon:yes stop_codon:yes gene_type:complete
MESFEKQNRLVAMAVLLFAFLIYLKTVAPTVTFWDTGEFIAASHILGVPHPPGAPFHTLLGRFFSMLPIPGEIAFRVNIISVIAAAVTVLLIYLCVVRLLSIWLETSQTLDRIAIFAGGAVGALSTAFSTSFWSNATEAEVYALSMMLTLLAFWLALRWDGNPGEKNRDRLLIFIVYLFGLGAGVHLQCLLTIPGILILIFTDLLRTHRQKDQVTVVLALILYPFLSIILPMEFKILMSLGILVALVVLRTAWRNPWFWICGLGVGLLGYSTYQALFIRSGLNPIIDMNNPENWENFKAFLSREQYGTHSITPRRGAVWTYQLNIHIKYFLQQFPFYDEGVAGGFFSLPVMQFLLHKLPFYDMLAGTFRRAVNTLGSNFQSVPYSVLPIALGIGGAIYHFRKDWKRFATVFALFSLMGIGLVIYLNMPDPEPREREYIFVGAYTFFGIWMGIGAAGLIHLIGRSTVSLSMAGAIAVVTLLFPIGILGKNYYTHNRSQDYVAHDYAYNILQSCPPNTILFTNGDNDTYPLWFLQYVKGVRRDVRVTNLSLLKTTWYVKQLRDLEPKIPIGMTDQQINQQVTARPWRETKDIPLAGLTIKGEEIPTAEYLAGNSSQRIRVLESHSYMIWWIVQKNNWERPIYFSVTVPESNMAGLKPFLSMEGMGYRLVKERAPGQFDVGLTADHLMNTYRFSGVADQNVYKDAVARRLLGNYLVLFDGLIRAYLQQDLPAMAFQTLQKAEVLVPPHSLDTPLVWASMANHYRQTALKFAEAGRPDSALVCLEELIRLDPETTDRQQIEETIRTWQHQIDSL